MRIRLIPIMCENPPNSWNSLFTVCLFHTPATPYLKALVIVVQVKPSVNGPVMRRFFFDPSNCLILFSPIFFRHLLIPVLHRLFLAHVPYFHNIYIQMVYPVNFPVCTL